jgi:hypothetical protein
MTTTTDYIVQFLTELIGTFIFLVVIISTGNALLIGLTLTALIAFAFFTSTGNFNPAVSTMFYLYSCSIFRWCVCLFILPLLSSRLYYCKQQKEQQ